MLDKLISTFIWQRKRLRVRLNCLHLLKDKGGLSLPNLKNYYWAAQINAIVAWIGNDREAIWTQIEQDSVKGVPLSILPFIDTKSMNKIKIKGEWIKNTLKVWTTVRKMLGGPQSISRAMLIVGNIEFPPSVWDSGFRRWGEKGLHTINHLFKGTELKSFSQLQEQFNLPSNDLYRYFQIRHYIISHKERDNKRLITDTLQNTNHIKENGN